MNKILRSLSTALLPALLLLGAGCQGRELTGGTAPDAAQGRGVLTFSLPDHEPAPQTPQSRETTLRGVEEGTTKTIAATERERKINSLMVLFFEQTGSRMLAKAMDATPDAAGSTAYTLDTGLEGTYDLLFVANAPAALRSTLAGARDYDAVKSAVVDHTPGADGFVMTGSRQAVTLTALSSKNIGEVKLTRLAVRIDVYNGIKGLKMTAVTLKNYAPKSLLLTEGTGLTYTAQDRKLDFATDFGGREGLIKGGLMLKEALYSYERAADGTHNPHLVVEATYDGHTIEPISIPLQKREGGSLKDISLERNHLYSIYLVEQTGDDPNIHPLPGTEDGKKWGVKLIVKDWDEAITLREYDKHDLRNDRPMLALEYMAPSTLEASGKKLCTHHSGDQCFRGTHIDAMKYLPMEVDGVKYYLPSAAEIASVFPTYAEFNDKDLTYDFFCAGLLYNNTTALGVKENCIIGGKEYKGLSDFKLSSDGKLLYAIRLKGTEQESAWLYNFWDTFDPIPEHPKVATYSCIAIHQFYLGPNSGKTIDEISTHSFWNQARTSGEVVTRKILLESYISAQPYTPTAHQKYHNPKVLASGFWTSSYGLDASQHFGGYLELKKRNVRSVWDAFYIRPSNIAGINAIQFGIEPGGNPENSGRLTVPFIDTGLRQEVTKEAFRIVLFHDVPTANPFGDPKLDATSYMSPWNPIRKEQVQSSGGTYKLWYYGARLELQYVNDIFAYGAKEMEELTDQVIVKLGGNWATLNAKNNGMHMIEFKPNTTGKDRSMTITYELPGHPEATKTQVITQLGK